LAADAVPAVVVAATPPPPWQGVYVGAGGGGGWGRLDGHAETDIAVTTGFHPHIDAFGGFWTVTAGGDIQRGPYVFGLFVDYASFSEFDGTSSTTAPPVRSATWQLDNVLTVAGRAGFAWSPVSMIYGLAGWSRIEGSRSFAQGCAAPATCIAFSGPHEADGWTVGAGLERIYHDRWSLRLEYRYTRLNDEAISATCLVCVPDIFASFSGDGYIQSLRAVATLRFGFPRIF
jgi:opacity protein-like surface antigen